MIIFGGGALTPSRRRRHRWRPPPNGPKRAARCTDGWNGFNDPAHRRLARGRARSRPGHAQGPRHADGRRGRLSARRRRGRHEGARATRSSSIRAATAMPAPTAPTSSCPAAAYTEKSATYVNLEGRAQMTAKAAAPRAKPRKTGRSCARCRPKSARRCRSTPCRRCARPCTRPRRSWPVSNTVVAPIRPASRRWPTRGGTMTNVPFKPTIADFYLTNPISRASAIMAELSVMSSGKAKQAAE